MTRARFWSALLAALLIGIAATYGILRLHSRAADYSAASLLVSEIETGARHLSATEWEAVAERQLEEGETEEQAEEDPREVEAELTRTVERLRRAEAEDQLGGGAQVNAVRETFRGYQAAVRAQFDQLTTEGASVAAGLDERQVDPAFDRFSQALDAARVHDDASARRGTRNAQVGAVILVVLAGVIWPCWCGGPSGPRPGRPPCLSTSLCTTR
jgi:hypothetical protein